MVSFSYAKGRSIKMEYKIELDNVFKQLGDSGIIVLATSSEDIPTARSMSYVVVAEKIYFQTESAMEKAAQMKQNPNVALCQSNIAIKGTAKCRGRILSEENAEVMELYKQRHRGSYDAYSHMEKGVLYEITPNFITIWTYIDGEPYRKYIDCGQSKAWMEHYEHSK
jgi:uncharacterized pyridoxamine 5'-phosphate oxidase family protein